jgi:hypothetical protein
MASIIDDTLHVLIKNHHLMAEELHRMSAAIDHLRASLQEQERQSCAVVCLQAAAQGLLACRRAQVLRAAKASEEQAAVRLQAAVRVPHSGKLANHSWLV